MSADSQAHGIRAALGKAFHGKTQDPEGKVDIESIATEHNVSESQVQEQVRYLHMQNMIRGPLANEGLQVRDVPYGDPNEHELTDEGLAWSLAGYPVI